MIRVLIADDHAVVREGLRRILLAAGDMTVAGEAATAQELLQLARQVACDVALVDLSMPGSAGLEALRELRSLRPGLPIVVLSIHPESQYAVRVIQAGAYAYLGKSVEPTVILHAIRKAYVGERYITEEVGQLLADHLVSARDRAPHELLSDREFQVLEMLAKGKTVTEIAAELSLSTKTVSTYRARVLAKLGARTNADLTRYALTHGLG
ncbi:MAG: response regulator transcription factor [Fimbriimonadia bacterium]|jgi:DNA-binding NarL/FixJ family response regulator